MSTRKNSTYATAALIAGGLVAIAAGGTAASAATTHGTVTAVTKISGRPDSGGAGTWATDKFNRTLTVTYLGKGGPAATPYQYMASVADSGTFLNLPGQLTPNQGGSDAGKVMKATQVGGPMSGFGQWGVFDASAKDARGLVPTQLRGAINALYPSDTWPELAFPAGTSFAGVSEANFGYGYTVPAVTTYTVKTVNGHKVTVKHVAKAQAWSDTAYNGDGQLARDGNITGR
jgi:hypothetical protein